MKPQTTGGTPPARDGISMPTPHAGRQRALELRDTPVGISAFFGRPAQEFQTASIAEALRRLQLLLVTAAPQAFASPVGPDRAVLWEPSSHGGDPADHWPRDEQAPGGTRAQSTLGPLPGPAAKGSTAAEIERAALFRIGWSGYQLLTGSDPAAELPYPFPYSLKRSDLIPVRMLRPETPPALARLVERLLTAPPRAELPSLADVATMLRTLERGAHAGRTDGIAAAPLASPTDGLNVRMPPRADQPHPMGTVARQLRSLIDDLSLEGLRDGAYSNTSRLRGLADMVPSPASDRAALFRVGWAGYELLTSHAPYDDVEPYMLVLDHPETLIPVRTLRPDTPPPLAATIEQLLNTGRNASVPGLRDLALALRDLSRDGVPFTSVHADFYAAEQMAANASQSVALTRRAPARADVRSMRVIERPSPEVVRAARRGLAVGLAIGLTIFALYWALTR